MKGKARKSKGGRKRVTAVKRAAPRIHKAQRGRIIHPARIRKAHAVKRTGDKIRKTRKAAARAGKEADEVKKATMGLPAALETKDAIDALLRNERVIGYLKKNVSKKVTDVISLLTAPRTDEYITEKLGIKINAVRRMLNIMQNYGITNYYVSKNKDGWLSFAWYVNTGKLPSFLEYVQTVEAERPMIDADCNDYFVCNGCYSESKLIFTFDAAYEAGFKCSACGKVLERVGDKTDVEKLLAAGAAPEEE